jgi:hypothetical protein
VFAHGCVVGQEQIEDLQKLHKNFWEALMDRLLPWRLYRKRKQERAQNILDYRKKLLVTRKDRQKQGVVLGEEKGRKRKRNNDKK